jgi:hypothetical protein
MKIVCILPTHNESETLARTIGSVVRWMQARFSNYDCVTVISENGSSDDTAAIARSLAETLPNVRAISSLSPGKGGAIKRAASAFEADIFIAMDCDLSTGFATAEALVSAVRSGADLAIASRRMPGSRVTRPVLRRLMTWAYSTVASRYLDLGIRDMQCGCKAWSRSFREGVLKDVADDGFFFDTELLVRARKAACRIEEIAAEWHEPPGRKSTVRLFPTAVSFLRKLVALKKSNRS